MTTVIATVGNSGALLAKEENETDLPVAADFTLRATEHRNIRLAEMRGHPLLIHFAAPWCRQCPEQLQTIYHAYTQLNIPSPATLLIALAPKSGVPTDHTLNQHPQSALLFDDNGKVGQAYQVEHLPTSLLIDANGYIIKRFDKKHSPLSELDTALQHMATLPELPLPSTSSSPKPSMPQENHRSGGAPL